MKWLLAVLLLIPALAQAQPAATATWHGPELTIAWDGFACLGVEGESAPRVCGTQGYQEAYAEALALVGRRVIVVNDASVVMLDTVIPPPAVWLQIGWSAGDLHAAWLAPMPVCVFVVGRLYPATCAASGSTTIPRYGDAAYVATVGRVVELRTAWGLAPVAQTVIPPEYAAHLPLVAGP